MKKKGLYIDKSDLVVERFEQDDVTKINAFVKSTKYKLLFKGNMIDLVKEYESSWVCYILGALILRKFSSYDIIVVLDKR